MRPKTGRTGLTSHQPSASTARLAAPLALLLVLAVTLMGSPAQADTTETTTTDLTIVDFDPSVATANGYETRVISAGQTVTVKIGQPTSTGMVPPAAALGSAAGRVITPYGTVSGRCGTSSVFLSNSSSLKYRVDTGWYVVSPAISYSWSVAVTAPKYSKTHTWGGGLLLRQTWAGSATATISTSQRGDFYAYTSGTVVLANGAKCSSAHPTDIETIL